MPLSSVISLTIIGFGLRGKVTRNGGVFIVSQQPSSGIAFTGV